MAKAGVAAKVCVLLLAGILLSGCGDKFLDPTQIGRFRPVPAVNVILDTLGVAEEEPSPFEAAEEPRPIDILAYDTDYTFGPGDVVRISIYELLQQGDVFVNDYSVTESGNISIPEVGVIGAEGLTEAQLEEQIKQILSPSILRQPAVTATLMSSQQQTFAILGNGIPRPDRYVIPRYDFRLNEALATAGGISQFNISYVYVARRITAREETYSPEAEPDSNTYNRELEVIRPSAKNMPKTTFVLAAAEMAGDMELAQIAEPEKIRNSNGQDGAGLDLKELLESLERSGTAQDSNEILEKGGLEELLESLEAAGAEDEAKAREFRETIDEPIDVEEAEQIEWIFQDGKWIPVRVGRAPTAEREVNGEREAPRKPIPADLDWEKIGDGGAERRLLRIPADKLAGGDPRYNVIIRPGDVIHVPVDVIGEFYIGGNTNFQGYIDMTGRPMTLKMAIVAAGGLGPLAWPKRCEVVRRIGKEKEEIVMVDLDKIAGGEQPDFFIKPNDLINVGTHSTARWRAVLRNAFRATYGFGFIYDRNFADRDFGTSRPFSFF